MRRWNVARGIVAVAIAACLLCCSVAQAKKPDNPGNGGGGGGEAPAPSLVYITNDAVVTVASADGEVIGKLTGGSKGYSIARTATWSPDGTQIAYLEGTESKNQGYVVDLYVMNADGSAKTFIHRFTRVIKRYSEFEWLPGGYISYQDLDGPVILDMLGGTTQRIGLEDWHDWIGISTIGPGVDPTVAGSQGLIVYKARDRGLTNATDLHLAVLTVDADGSILLDPTTIKRLDRPAEQGFPVVSPDGLQVVFYDNASADGGDVAVVDLDYSEGVDFGAVQFVRVAPGEIRLLPTWSPDSLWIAFTWAKNLTPGSGAWEIARIRSDGTDFTNVTNSAAHEVGPDWFPVLPTQP